MRRLRTHLNLGVVVLVVVFPAIGRGQTSDLALAVASAPDPVTVNELLTFRVTLTNRGPAGASGLQLTNTWSTNAAFFSVLASQGTCVAAGHGVACDLGALAVGSNAVLTVVVMPLALGTVIHTAQVTADGADPVTSNNRLTNSVRAVPSTFYQAGSLRLGRYQHTATLLPNGKVLLAGGLTSTGATATAELYDPRSNTFDWTGSMDTPRHAHTGTVLPNGKVLIVGMSSTQGATPQAQLYDPGSGTFTNTGGLSYPRNEHAATLLPDGRVLIAGGSSPNGEIYDPLTGAFTEAGRMQYSHGLGAAVGFPNGDVVIVGGFTAGDQTEIFRYDLGTFQRTGQAVFNLWETQGVLLPDGRAFLVGGAADYYAMLAATQFYDPVSGTFTRGPDMRHRRFRHTTSQFAPGKVLVTGGWEYPTLANAEVFDLTTGVFTQTVSLRFAREWHAATVLADGRVLVTGGHEGALYGTNVLDSAELYDPANAKLPPMASLANASVTEPDAGRTNIDFTVTLSSPMGVPVTVGFATSVGPWDQPASATAGEDYVATEGVVTFAPGTTNQAIAVRVMGDRDHEGDETFYLTLTWITNASFASTQAVATILDNDPKPSIFVGPAEVLEGNSDLVFPVWLSGRSAEDIGVAWTTTDGMALAGRDYAATSGYLVFLAGTTNQSFRVRVKADPEIEPDETFSVLLSEPYQATLGNASATGTILNDDGLPGEVDHFEIAVVPGRHGAGVPFEVIITARDASGNLATNFNAHAALMGGLSNAPTLHFDFEDLPPAGWDPVGPIGPFDLRYFAPFDANGDGEYSQAFALSGGWGTELGITRNVIFEGGRRYLISVDAGLTNVSTYNVYLRVGPEQLAGLGLGTPPPTGEFRHTTLWGTFTPPTNGVYPLAVVTTWWFEQTGYFDDVFVSPVDFLPRWVGPFTNGVWRGGVSVGSAVRDLRFSARDVEGQAGLSEPVEIEPVADVAVETSVSPARVGSQFPVTLTVRNHGPSGVTRVTLTNILTGDVMLVSATSSQGACALAGNTVGCDFGSLTNGQIASVTIVGRAWAIGMLTNLASVSAHELDYAPANNNTTNLVSVAPPFLYVESPTVPEGDLASSNIEVAVRLDGPSGQTISVNYATADGSAMAGSDYVAGVGQLVFPPGLMTQWVTVEILGDLLDEPNESFSVNLFNPTNVALAQGGTGLVTITDNDPPVTIFIGDVVVIEGSSGTTPAAFPVTLSQPSGHTVSVTWGTSNGTAVANSDYAPVSGATLSFPPGTTSNAIVVGVRGNTVNESNETFYVYLRNPVNATVADAAGLGTILNDDDVPGQLDHFEWTFIPPWQITNRPISVTVRALDPFNNIVSNFNGAAAFTGTARTGAVSVLVLPTTPGTFSSGVWTGAVWLPATNVHVVLKADDGQEHVGLSSPFNVLARFPLLLSLPVSATEGDGVLAGQGRLTTTIAQSNGVAISLVSSRPDQLTVPAALQLSAGQTSVVFDVTVIDDGFLNGSRPILVTASATDHAPSTMTLVLHDDESAALALVVPASVTEGAGTLAGAGTIQVSSPPAVDVAVALTSSDPTELQVPGSVIIPAGQTSAVFTLTVLNDDLIDGPQSATVTAHVEDWTDGMALVAVLDDESTNLVLQVPSSVVEGQGTATNAGTIRIGGTLGTNLVVAFSSSAPGELMVPSTAVIPAGQTNARFNLTVIDDSEFDGSQTVTVSASAAGLGPTSALVIVRDNDVHHFSFAPISLLQTASVPFAVSLSARDINDAIVSTFAGTAALSGGGDRGAVVLQPTNTSPFQSGQWTGTVTIAYWDTGIRLTARAGGITGTSNPFDALAPVIQFLSLPAADLIYDRFVQRLYVSVPATGGALSNRVAVIEPVFGRVESSFYAGEDPGRLALSDDGRLLYVACNGSRAGSNSVRRFDLTSRTLNLEIFFEGLPNNPTFTKHAYDMDVLPGDGHSLAVIQATVFGTYSPTLQIYDDGVMRTNTIEGPITVLAASTNRVYTGCPFMRANLDASGAHFFDSYNGFLGYPDTMKIQDGLVFTRYGRVFNPETLQVLGDLPPSYWVEPDLAVGRVFTVFNAEPYQGPWILYACDPVSLQPVGSLLLSGVSGGPATLIRWGTNGLAFHTFGNQVCLVRTPLVPSGPPADLAVTVTAAPSEVTLTGKLTYTIRITNRGPNVARDARLTDRLPAGVNFVAATASLGSCALSSGVLTCMLGDLVHGGEAAVTMGVTPFSLVPALTNVAVVSAASPDSFLTNNNVVTLTATDPDIDADGLPDVWERRYFGSLDAPNGGPGTDADGDGLTNQEEFLTGTSPIDMQSALRIAGVRLEGAGVRIEVATVPGRRYRVEKSGQPRGGTWTPVGADIVGVDGSVMVRDEAAASGRQGFYRVALQP